MAEIQHTQVTPATGTPTPSANPHRDLEGWRTHIEHQALEIIALIDAALPVVFNAMIPDPEERERMGNAGVLLSLALKTAREHSRCLDDGPEGVAA